MNLLAKHRKRKQLKKEIAEKKKEEKKKEQQRKREEEQKARKEKGRIACIPKTIDRLRSYPVVKLTREEFANMPKGGKDFTKEWLRNEALFGFKFICRSFPEHPKDLIMMGHLVPGEEALHGQYGAGLSFPEKFINSYRVVFVE